MEELISLQKEDFSDFKIGPFPYDKQHSAMGEYHYYPAEGYKGNWYCPTTDHGWRGAMWLIVRENDRLVMEANKLKRNKKFVWNLLVTGDDDWTDYQLEADIRMLDTSWRGGLAFRYQNSRCHYLFCFDDGKVKLIRKNHEDILELFASDYKYNCDQFYHCRIELKKEKITCYLDNEFICSVEDKSYKQGRIALVADTVVQFSNIEVKTDKNTYDKIHIKKISRKRRLQAMQDKYPQPLLWKKIDLKDFGAGRSIRFGDLSGNGELDILLAQCQKRIYKDSYANITCLTAIDLEGNVLWQLGDPDPENAFITADLPVQIFDIDNDGKNEVIVSRDFKLMILEGATGNLKKSISNPLSTEADDDLYTLAYNRYTFDRVVFDSIRICNLSGGEQPRDILIKDRYSRLWAYDNNLNLLWKYRDTITGHYPYSKDLNGDGREEIFIGYNLLDADGNIIWRLPVKTDHTDEIIIGSIDHDRREEVIAIVSGNEGFITADLDGNIIKQHLIGHAQRISAGNYCPELRGYEMAVTTYWGNQGTILVYDCHGNLLFSFEPGTNGNIIAPVNWTGDGQDLILLNGNVEKGGMIDGYGNRVVLFPADGHPELCAEVLDITDDCRDEIILWDEKELWIYTQDQEFKGENLYCPQKYPLYNASNYRGEYSWSE